MEGKEIIENMTKGEWNVIFGNQIALLSCVSVMVDNGNKKTLICEMTSIRGDSYNDNSMHIEANAKLIAEAGTVANQTGLTPSQLQSELEKAKELLKDAKSLYGYKDGYVGKYKEFWNKLTTFLEGSGNKTK